METYKITYEVALNGAFAFQVEDINLSVEARKDIVPTLQIMYPDKFGYGVDLTTCHEVIQPIVEEATDTCTKEDVLKVSKHLGKTLTDEEINKVISAYPGEARQDPSGYWELWIENLIYQVDSLD